MNLSARHKALAAGTALILLANIVVIVGVMWNRSGEPDSVVLLTERELPMQYSRRENSGLSLQFDWNINYTYRFDWLDAAKLDELGFRHLDGLDAQNLIKYSNKAVPRSAYIVLEYDGPAFQAEVQEAEANVAKEAALLAGTPDNKEQQLRLDYARRNLEQLRHSSSRLIPVDAGLDHDTLRRRYPDSTRYIIAGGQIQVFYSGSRNGGIPYGGRISDIDVTSIHVPLEFRSTFDKLPDRQYHKEGYTLPRYRVELAYGKRLEPWIRAVSRIEQ